MGILNASGRPIAAMVADEAGNGVLGIEDGKFLAHVDSRGQRSRRDSGDKIRSFGGPPKRHLPEVVVARQAV